MANLLKLSSALAALALSAALFGACGPANTSSQPDPYYGFLDLSDNTTQFASITQPAFADSLLPFGAAKGPDGGILLSDGGVGPTQRCPSGNCYPVQSGYVEGRYINFYNVMTLTASTGAWDSGTMIPVSQAVSQQAFDFPTECSPGQAADPFADAYGHDVQYPVFATIPFAAPTGARYPITPVVAVYGVNGLTGNRCNDIKSAYSLGFDGGSPKFNAQPATKASSYALWVVVDETQNFAAPNFGTPPPLNYGWFKDLQFAFFNGGPVPTDSSGANLVTMDGVIVDPTSATSFSKSTDKQAVILQFAPGEGGFSPIVRLHDFHLPAGKTFGDFTGICTSTSLCGSRDVCLSYDGGCTGAPNAVPASGIPFFNTIFIAAAP